MILDFSIEHFNMVGKPFMQENFRTKGNNKVIFPPHIIYYARTHPNNNVGKC